MFHEQPAFSLRLLKKAFEFQQVMTSTVSTVFMHCQKSTAINKYVTELFEVLVEVIKCPSIPQIPR